MSTVNPNEGVAGSGQTVGGIIAPAFINSDDPDAPAQIERAANHLKDFEQFLFLQNEEGTDGATMEATDLPGEYILTTDDGQQFSVINTDEVELDPEAPLELEEGQPNLIIGGTQGIHVQGSDEDNKIFGNQGDNVIHGGAGNDILGGGGGNNVLDGGEGNDLLIGGSGNDVLTGGAGADRFDFTPRQVPKENPDPDGEPQTPYRFGDSTITDFGADGDDDTLILGDFNNDGVFDSQDFTIANHQSEDGSSGALITFIGPDGSVGSVFLKGVDANQLNVSFEGVKGQVKLLSESGPDADTQSASLRADSDEDDDLFFTVM